MRGLRDIGPYTHALSVYRLDTCDIVLAALARSRTPLLRVFDFRPEGSGKAFARVGVWSVGPSQAWLYRRPMPQDELHSLEVASLGVGARARGPGYHWQECAKDGSAPHDGGCTPLRPLRRQQAAELAQHG